MLPALLALRAANTPFWQKSDPVLLFADAAQKIISGNMRVYEQAVRSGMYVAGNVAACGTAIVLAAFTAALFSTPAIPVLVFAGMKRKSKLPDYLRVVK